MRKIAIALVATISLHGITAQAPQKKQQAQQQQAGQKQLTPAEKAEMQKMRSLLRAALDKTRQELNTKVQAKLAQAQLQEINRRHKGATAMLPLVEPVAKPALQERIAKIQAAMDEVNRTKAPIALEKFLPKTPLVARNSELFQKHDSANTNEPARRVERKSAPGGNSNTSGPTITKIIVNGKPGNSGQPGDTVMIEGTGFGSNPTVYFMVGNGNQQTAKLNSTFTGKTSILAYVPEVSAIPKYIGQVAVTTANGSDAKPFTFLPEIQSQTLPVTPANVQWAFSGCYQYDTYPPNGQPFENCWIAPGAGLPDGADQQLWIYPSTYPNPPSASDVFFSGYKLPDGWLFDSIVLQVTTSIPPLAQNAPGWSCCGQATIQGATYNSRSPQFTVTSTGNPNSIEEYTLAVIVRGPAGMCPTASGKCGQ